MSTAEIDTSFGEINVTYTTDLGRNYSKAIDHAKSKLELEDAIASFGELAWDAALAARELSNWREWRGFVISERKGISHSEALYEKYAAILLPEPLLAIGLVAVRFGVPDGCALIRLLETGKAFRENGKLNVDALKQQGE